MKTNVNNVVRTFNTTLTVYPPLVHGIRITNMDVH